jgi:hypothetical protein
MTSLEWERKHQRSILFLHRNRACRQWVRIWKWIDGMNHDKSGKRTDDMYPVIGAPRFYWLCDLADAMTRGWAHD